MVARERVATAAIALTTAMFLLISLSSYIVFGEGSQSGEPPLSTLLCQSQGQKLPQS